MSARTIIPVLVFSAVSILLAAVDVLMAVPHRYGANYNFNMHRLNTMGWNVTTAAVSDSVQPCYSGLPVLEVDTLFSELEDISDYDVLAVTSATWRYQPDPYRDLMDSVHFMNLLQHAVDLQIPVWTTCVGPRILAFGDMLEGVEMQGQPGYNEEYLQEYLDAGAVYLGTGLPPVIHCPFVTTSRGQYYQTENWEAVAMMLAMGEGPSCAEKRGNFDHTLTSSDDGEWSLICGGGDMDGGRAICQSAEGDLYAAGYTYSSSEGWSDLLALKADADGNILWTESFGGPGWEYGNDVCISTDGCVLAVGSSTSYGDGLQDMYMVKLDAQGNLLWSRTYGTASFDEAASVISCSDGSIVLCGTTFTSPDGESDIIVVKTDSDGNVIWQKMFGGTGPETGDRIVQTADGNYLIAGSTGSYTANRD
ncbi:MAG: hypothetical protein GF388_07360, partial [Candidatus Aegiribacteria sp.]|nr:hypothetical protein [Candidatus Aegiribacteria sp.]MBD3294948.1 hypothetical protein [Candidatus Fermentibacteria bacterium]